MNIWQTNGDMQQTIIDDSEINEPETEREEATDITKAEHADNTGTIDNVADNVERARTLSHIAELLRSYECQRQTADNEIITVSQTGQAKQQCSNSPAQVFKRIERGIRAVWNKRPKLSYALYAIVFVAITAVSVLFLQWSVYTEAIYAEDAEVDDATRILGSVSGQLTRFVSQMWLEGDWRFLLNFLALGLIYLTIIAVLNRFWISTALFGSIMVIFAIANKFKVEARNEPIIPADMNFISGGNTGELMSFIPTNGMHLVNTAITGLMWFIGVCIGLQFLDRRNGLIPVQWRPSRFVSVKNMAAAVTRIVAATTAVVVLSSFVWNLTVPNSWSSRLATNLSDAPEMWNGMGDAVNNGPAMTFLRLVHTEIMDEPEGYSEAAMRDIAERYTQTAELINSERSNEMTDSTVIMILSESFSDPTRVSGISFSEDPMPAIRSVKNTTTSGLMVSPAYGGGTANIEFQALTGLSMALYDPTLSSAYQQLVPNMDNPFSFNQLWNNEQDDGSVAFHPYNRNMYFRDRNYRSFGFSRFYASDGEDQMTDLAKIDAAWYASDESTYRNVLDYLSETDNAEQFVQVVTMQNHMPYDSWYQNNQFIDGDTSVDLTDDERVSVETYAKGVNYTDQATAQFLEQLNQMDRPITVIFYGDHLPGIYQTAVSNPDAQATLYETDYFIWSNNASSSAGTKLSEEDAAFSSSNFFMAELAEHMNAKVSPYLAFLTQMHHAIAAIGPASLNDGTNPAYFNSQGQLLDYNLLPDEDRTLLYDYQLIQYDISVGRDYLRESAFMDIH